MGWYHKYDGFKHLEDVKPKIGTCILVWDPSSMCVYGAYMDDNGDFYEWRPGEHNFGTEVKIELDVDLWCYPPYPDFADEEAEQKFEYEFKSEIVYR